ncbi:HEPN domain-containing protein [Marinilabilia salmonicolor]|jgi:HEPN domain-containing protein|uniref:HEPN domain-containing protein n=1 Tax=Marinilabilia salmonicolor TaxID=989 RepID=A0A2T0XEU6_9BACT|nr:HEPN domain-containing protein [Marinilabilia salmonicolor]PRY97445.1 HEPN domain-containing protein [Marinilabilia salmonicolor]RCW35326.1 HEPN domain-containing protein [Marinilabilia salmonicolor]
MNKDTKDFIKQWLIKANEDLLVVKRLVDYEIIATSSACFHCQQAVEKLLKAFLIANNVEIKKTHNIEFLLSECSDIDKDFANIDPKELSDFGVDVRYPGDMYIPDESETIEYQELALDIKAIVENKIIQILESK